MLVLLIHRMPNARAWEEYSGRRIPREVRARAIEVTSSNESKIAKHSGASGVQTINLSHPDAGHDVSKPELEAARFRVTSPPRRRAL